MNEQFKIECNFNPHVCLMHCIRIIFKLIALNATLHSPTQMHLDHITARLNSSSSCFLKSVVRGILLAIAKGQRHLLSCPITHKGGNSVIFFPLN